MFARSSDCSDFFGLFVFFFCYFFQFFLISQCLQSNNDNDRGINIFGAFLCRELVLTHDSEWGPKI